MKQARTVTLPVKVVPGASRTEIAGWLGHRLKLRVRQPAHRGQANVAVIALIAQQLALSPADVRISRGAATPVKTLIIDGLDAATLRDRLKHLTGATPD
ncbi:DUF167 domain-containing protein [Spectribacter hydrogenoxidans]|uniref:UPF0235 protein RM532_05410 n=1 Tax=Spectribacter hydrogenoxidans TaxID=3075608 RepID=A0ABU3BYP7_9GAMM|nr:DUF167 domain-containing protein [Salinisphaera sp. W335]MDT0634390.1 DUF167 domain-containing protein [Salinisphaera sp. W335]